ncbi:hypothetical protein C5O19_14790 [Siphonobacter curvatus]|uniref:Uncharacterized protein n=1 Tax=Siphonobacter curvatus TaxID=2094562 RepID=A0A2S7ISX7_9BACT|nr:hypothetical protein C5O19_14790 [Siphonobacter curvatus]
MQNTQKEFRSASKLYYVGEMFSIIKEIYYSFYFFHDLDQNLGFLPEDSKGLARPSNEILAGTCG